MPIRNTPNDYEKTNNSVEKYYAKDENFEQPKNEIPPLDPKDSSSFGSTLYRLFRYMFNKKK